jgi:P4 family phage/plasmid primase-like protien
MIYFKTKSAALKKITSTSQILCNRSITNYFIMESHQHFLDLIKTEVPKDFYEYIPNNVPVPIFFDIEIYKDASPHFDAPEEFLNNLFDKFHFDTNTTVSKVILESHSDTKKSYHIIMKLIDSNNNHLLCKNVKELKTLHKELHLDTFKDTNNKYLIDPSVYREGLFRTIYSSKLDENRPLVKSALSDDFDELESLVTYYSTLDHDILDTTLLVSPEIVETPELDDRDKRAINDFVASFYYFFPNKIREILVDTEHNCIVVALNVRQCNFINREHRSNNQYIVIDTTSAKQKCHDPECNEQKYKEIKLENYPSDLVDVVKKCLRMNRQELELIDRTVEACRTYLNENYDSALQNVVFDRNEMMFRGDVLNRDLARNVEGACPECNVEHQISDNGYCLKCRVCNSIFPRTHHIPVHSSYGQLTSFWSNYNQLTNNGTINNIINIYNGETEFSCDIKLENNIFRNREVTTIVNQILDGHKITMVSKLIHAINKNFMYSRNNWYFFTGSIWKADNDNIELKKQIIELSKVFDRIRTHYEFKTDDTTMQLKKNVKSIINKFHKPGFQDDVIKGAKIYFNDEHFINNLNSKKHLVPFSNGVYDLLEHKFRKTKKDDYINLTMNYDFSETIRNPEVYTFLDQVLPVKSVRDYVLKKMSECLNGDIPNTYFLMFIGDTGANGKSQLLNLMKLAMGDFGEKVEVTLLTRKRNNANEANSEKIKLLHKRFAFLSEPEDGEKINIGLLKELTGSEEIVARGLYQESVSFVMEAKLFLACNELPEIKGEDTALWRRIRVIDFPSRFVDEPKDENEYKIDRTLPSRMREDLSWRQTFMSILLEYYYKDVIEPVEVQVKTNEYRQENNDFYNWLVANVEEKKNHVLKLKDVIEMYTGKPCGTKGMHVYKREIEKFLKDTFKTANYKYQNTTHEGRSYRGWLHFDFKAEDS